MPFDDLDAPVREDRALAFWRRVILALLLLWILGLAVVTVFGSSLPIADQPPLTIIVP
ncbi:MAG: hypothetical protein WDO24_19530 [Pseudomonadota bacterium]